MVATINFAAKSSSSSTSKPVAVAPDQSSLFAEIEALRQENARLKSKATSQSVKGLSLRVSAKGAVSVYGLGRFPVTLYRGQWERLLGRKEELLAFIAENASTLTTKE